MQKKMPHGEESSCGIFIFSFSRHDYADKGEPMFGAGEIQITLPEIFYSSQHCIDLFHCVIH